MRQEHITIDIVDQEQAYAVAAEANMNQASVRETVEVQNQTHSLYEASAGKVFDTPYGLKGTIDELLSKCPVPPHLRSPQKTEEFLAKLYVFNDYPAPKGHEQLLAAQQIKHHETPAKPEKQPAAIKQIAEAPAKHEKHQTPENPATLENLQNTGVQDQRRVEVAKHDQQPIPAMQAAEPNNELMNTVHLPPNEFAKVTKVIRQQVAEIQTITNAPSAAEHNEQNVIFAPNVVDTIVELSRRSQEDDDQKVEVLAIPPTLIFDEKHEVNPVKEVSSVKNEVTAAVEKVMAFANSFLYTMEPTPSLEQAETEELDIVAASDEYTYEPKLESEFESRTEGEAEIHAGDVELVSDGAVDVEITPNSDIVAQEQLAAMYLGETEREHEDSVLPNTEPETEQKVVAFSDLLPTQVTVALAEMSEQDEPIAVEVADKLEYLDTVHQRLQYIVGRGEKDSPEALQIVAFIEQEVAEISELLRVKIEPQKMKLFLQKIVVEPEAVMPTGFVLPADAGTHEYKRDDNVWQSAGLVAIGSIAERAAKVAAYILRGFPEVA